MAAGMSNLGVIEVLDLDDGQSHIIERNGWVGHSSLHPDGTQLALARWADGPGVVEVVDTATGRLLRRMDGEFLRYIGALSWSPDGRWIAAGGDDEVRIWDADTGAVVRAFTGHERYLPRLDWSPDSTRVASASHDGTVRVWPVEYDGRPLLAPLTSATISGGSYGLSFDHTGTRVLAGDFTTDAAVLFDVSPAGSREWATLPVLPDDITDAAFIGPGRVVATGERRGLTLADARTGEPIPFGAAERGPPGQGIKVSPDGRWVLAMGNEHVRRFDATSGEEVRRVELTWDRPRPFDWHPSSDAVAVADFGSGATGIYDLDAMPIAEVAEGAGFGPAGVAFSPDGALLATARSPVGTVLNDWGVTVWDWETGNPERELPDLRGEALAFSPDASTLLVGNPSGDSVLVDVATGETTATLGGHRGGVLSVAYSADGSAIATSDGDGRIRLWDAESGAATGALPGHEGVVTSLEFSPDGTMLASAGYDGVARVWALEVDDLLAISAEKVTRGLTAAECERYVREGC